MNTPLTEEFDFKVTSNWIYLSNEKRIDRDNFEFWVWLQGRICDLVDIDLYWKQEPKTIIKADIQNYLNRARKITEWHRITDGIKHITDNFQ